MKIAILGTGYVGLVTGACFSESGNDVACIDIDQRKIADLTRGALPIFEPELEDIVRRNLANRRLRFTTDLASAARRAELVFLAVGTPSASDGSADLSALWSAVDSLAPHLASDAIAVIKSTVPVGANAAARQRLRQLTGRDCNVASNPEFLKEGAAVADFFHPDRVVVGVRGSRAAELLRELYAPFVSAARPFLVMSPESAELTKYAANALLATKISFINETANLCEQVGADIDEVRCGMGHDRRIGFEFLSPGVGYGGSCFPKDVRALSHLARASGATMKIADAVDAVNQDQKHVLVRKMQKHFDSQLTGKTIAVWGLAFKPCTDDVRESPAISLVEQLLELGARVHAHDPAAMQNARAVFGDKILYAQCPMDALDGADALAINTEWSQFRSPDFAAMRRAMCGSVIFDGRGLYPPDQVRNAGFTYCTIGRNTVRPEAK